MEKIKELEMLCKPLVEFLRENGCPYDHIVVSTDSVKIVNETANTPVN